MTTRAHFPPGPSGLPYVGNALAFQRDTLGFLLAAHEKYGPLVGLRF
jgi:hypothetical protein